MDNIAISVKKVEKTFKLPHERRNSVKSVFVNILRGRSSYELQHVLKGISFDIKKGEFFGIVGRNGSGKSTLLKLISGIYTPDKGKIEINGKLTPFIELGVGFSPELSGRENVYLNGALLGFNRAEVDKMYDEIVAFAELENFMDQKLKNYSSGMQVRLAFSIAIRANTDILVLDEVLAVGDQAFQKKCFEYFARIKNDKKTVILVTHDMGIAKKYCDRAILIEDGSITSEGKIDGVVSDYHKSNLKRAEAAIRERNAALGAESENSDNAASITRIYTEDKNGKEKAVFGPEEEIFINCEVTMNKEVQPPTIVLSINNPGGPSLAIANTKGDKFKVSAAVGTKAVARWGFGNIFNDGTYLVSATVYDQSQEALYGQAIEAFKFEIEGWKSPYGIVHPKSTLEFESKADHSK